MKRLMAFLLRALQIAVFLWFTAALVSASTVRGRLVRSNGYPATGVAVTVVNQQIGRSSPAYAGPDGMYYLYNVPAGYYYLEVWVNPSSPIVYQIQVLDPLTDVVQIVVP